MAAACGTTQPSASPLPSQTPTHAPSSAPTPPPPTVSPVVTPAPTETPAPAALLLEVTQEGGFIAPSAHLSQLPQVVVDTAGNIYTPRVAESTVGSLIPPVAVRNVGSAGAAQILAAMKAAGLDKEGSSGVAGDAGVTVFTAEIDGQEVVTRVAQEGPAGPGHPGASPQPALDLLNRLLDPEETWGATNVTAAPYTPAAYKVYVAPAPAGSTPTVTWPLSPVLSEFGSPATPNFGVDGLRTGVVTGANASTLATNLGAVASGTFASSDGSPYQVWIRPLLPPEIS